MTDDTLKPCPFCGSKAEFGSIDDSEHADFGGHFIYCTNALCQCSSALIFPLMDNVEGLLAARWNRRRKHDASEHEPDGIALIATERSRQIEQEGWTADQDDQHAGGELAIAAACYALAEYYRSYGRVEVDELPVKWPFQKEDWKPSPEDRLRELAIAGAFIADEMDRLIKMGSGKR